MASARRAYSDADAAALYDVLNPWGPSDDFYLELVRGAESVLDVGCGTGRLLHRARDAGHVGRLCGVDPDAAMLDVARRRPDVEWVPATAAAMTFHREFELVLMTGHAFQLLVTDEELRASFDAIASALREDGRFAFETRSPDARAWERWARERFEVVDPSGTRVVVSYAVEGVVDGVVTVTEITRAHDGTTLRADCGRLRFLDVAQLDRFLGEAGLGVVERYGGWRREPLEPRSEEIVTIAALA